MSSAQIFNPDQRIDKTVVITGASRGIGAATARHLAAKGARVVLGARTTDQIDTIAKDIVADGGAAKAVACDVTDYAQVQSLISTAKSAFGTVDVLINNAGLINPITRLGDSDPQIWGHIIDANYKGVYHGIHAALPEMLAQGNGTIINISSGAATSALEGWSHYCSSKAAVLSLTRCADKEYRDHGITVVGLSPGTVATDMQVSIRASGLNPVSQLDPSVHIPADWVAQAIAMLCTPMAEAFAGTDFSLKTEDGRKIAGLPAL